MTPSSLIARCQAALAATALGTRAMIKVRNQANAVIGYRVALGPDNHTNGESWLVQLIAPTASYFVDVGANVGNWCELFASQMPRPRGDAFEPFPGTFELLCDRLKGKQLNNIMCHMLAVGHEPGEGLVYAQGPGDEMANLTGRDGSPRTAVGTHIVTLDAFYHGRSIYIDMLKVDAEGWDFNVLRGATGLLKEKRIRTVQFEYNSPWIHTGSTLAQCVHFLSQLGYDCYILKGNNLYSFDAQLMGEYFRYTNYVAYERTSGHVLDSVPKLKIV